MSFGLKEFKQHKVIAKHLAPQFIRQVILGSDLWAVLRLCELKKECSPEALCLITERKITKQNLIDELEKTISPFRGEEGLTWLSQFISPEKIQKVEIAPQFLKEGVWREFGGRTKSMDMQLHESHFLKFRCEVKLADFFSESDYLEMDEWLEAYQKVKAVERIAKVVSTDLIDNAQFEISFKDFTFITTETLVTTDPAIKILKLTQNGTELSALLADQLALKKNVAGIHLYFTLNSALSSAKQTLFIPQSMTHEWGHFVLEFKDDHHLAVLIFWHEEEVQSEEMASKIRLCKRVLSRAFENFESTIVSEEIQVREAWMEWDKAELSLGSLIRIV